MIWSWVSDGRGTSRLAQHVALWILPIALLPAQSIAQMLTTIAGGGIGDGGVATSAHLTNPFGLAVDKEGNLYIAGTSNQRIQKVDPEGRITTVAGRG